MTGIEPFRAAVAPALKEDQISVDPEVRAQYASDASFVEGHVPEAVVWPTTTPEVQLLVRAAWRHGMPLVPVSSGGSRRHNGDTVPRRRGTVVVDLSRMNGILNVDRTNRVLMIEPGVTFAQLLPELAHHGLRALMPLAPRADKSVLASALEREPVTIPRYHWDTPDPLLCTEIVFGTGKCFRTGAAAGPGTLEDQRASGQAQKNPMGPTQFSVYRTVQGAQGSLGIVTWATLKCELAPTRREVSFVTGTSTPGQLTEIVDALRQLAKYRLGDELFLLNAHACATLLGDDAGAIRAFKAAAEWAWVVPVILSGRAPFAEDRIAYLRGDVAELVREHPALSFTPGPQDARNPTGIDPGAFVEAVTKSHPVPWHARATGAGQRIFYLSTLDRVPAQYQLVHETLDSEYPALAAHGLGVYVQPQLQGCNAHVEFHLAYDPEQPGERATAEKAFSRLSQALLEAGAFFSRPYGAWAPATFARTAPTTVSALGKVKAIFDPGAILHPGVLCFGDVEPRANPDIEVGVEPGIEGKPGVDGKSKPDRAREQGGIAE